MLELKNISKIFPGVKALDDVSLSFCKGEIHALMGENGAGKSTLMKIITGIYHPDMGEMYLDGEKADIKNFRDAVAHDINMVSQEIQVIPESTVAENIILDRIDQFKKEGWWTGSGLMRQRRSICALWDWISAQPRKLSI